MFGKRFYPVCVGMALITATSLTFADDKTQQLKTLKFESLQSPKDGKSPGHRLFILKNQDGNGSEAQLFLEDAEVVFGWSTDSGKVSRYMIGVECEPVSELLRHHLDIDGKQGLAIRTVVDESAAEKAGLQEYDIIVQLGNSPIASIGEIGAALDTTEGAEIDIHFIRRGKKQTAKITPIKRQPIINRRVIVKSDSGENDVDIDIEAITNGIMSVSPGLRFKADSILQDAVKKAMSAQSQRNQQGGDRIQRLEELQKKQFKQLETQIEELNQMIRKLTEASSK